MIKSAFQRRGSKDTGQLIGVVGLLLLFFWLAVSSMLQKSPTMDEQGFLLRGVAYVRGENRWMRVGHPAGLNILNGWLVAQDPTVRLPVDDPSWGESSFHRPAELFLWEMGNDVERIMLLGRLPTVWLGLLLGVVTGRWAREMSGKGWVGLLALALVCLDPNIIAHSRLITTDIGLAGGRCWRGIRCGGGWVCTLDP